MKIIRCSSNKLNERMEYVNKFDIFKAYYACMKACILILIIHILLYKPNCGVSCTVLITP